MNVWYQQIISKLFDPNETVCFALIEEGGVVEHGFASAQKALENGIYEYLCQRNSAASIYVGMNPFKDELRGAKKGRTEENVAKIKRLYADADENGLAVFEKLKQSTSIPQPHIVMETSPGKFQFIWNVDRLTQDSAKKMLKALAQELGTDPAVAETARVFRLPSFVNRKSKYVGEPIVKLVGNISNRCPYQPEDFKFSNTIAVKVDRKAEDWLDAPFIHGQLDNQICSFIGHYVSAKNINDPEELYTLITAKLEKNGCFERDGVTPFRWNDERVRELCRLKTQTWKTGEQQAKEAVNQALAEAANVAQKAELQLTTQPDAVRAELEPTEVVEVFDPKAAQAWQATDMSSLVMNGRLGELCNERMLKYFPVAYAWPALIAASSAMVPLSSQDNSFIQQSANMVNSYTALVGPVHSGKSQAILWATKMIGVPDTNYSDIKAGSSEGLLKKLAKMRSTGRIKESVLMDLDEWAHFFSKAGIENSSFTSFLHTSFYKRRQTIIAARGKEIKLDCSLSFIGGIVEDEFDTCFGATSLGGLHDRFTFGLCPQGFNFMYRPFEGSQEVFQPVPVQIAPEVHELVESIRKDKDNKHVIGREAEIAVRAAQVCASFDGVRVLDARYGERMIRTMIMEQSKVREYLQPNAGVTIDAQCANALVSWLLGQQLLTEWLMQHYGLK